MLCSQHLVSSIFNNFLVCISTLLGNIIEAPSVAKLWIGGYKSSMWCGFLKVFAMAH